MSVELRRVRKVYGVMDDVCSTLEEANKRRDFYSEGELIYIESEKRIYKVFFI